MVEREPAPEKGLDLRFVSEADLALLEARLAEMEKEKRPSPTPQRKAPPPAQVDKLHIFFIAIG